MGKFQIKNFLKFLSSCNYKFLLLIRYKKKKFFFKIKKFTDKLKQLYLNQQN